jgi:hypothetical protein
VPFANLQSPTADAAVERPPRLNADNTGRASILSVTIKVRGVGDKVWVTNPMSSDQGYTEASTGGGESSAGTIESLLNPDRLFLAAVQAIQNPTIDGTEKVDDVETTRIKGTVNLASLPAGTPFATPAAEVKSRLSDYFDLGEKGLTVWVDANGLVHRLQFAGAITKDEESDVIREIDLSHFDESQNIQPPAATPAAD